MKFYDERVEKNKDTRNRLWETRLETRFVSSTFLAEILLSSNISTWVIELINQSIN